MLTIRFLRQGKKHQPFFKIVVVEKHRSSRSGKFVEEVGFYNPLTKERKINKERVLYWIGVGAGVSDSVYNLLIREGVVSGKKRAVHSIKKKEKEAKEETKPESEAEGEAKEATEKEAKVEGVAEGSEKTEEAETKEEKTEKAEETEKIEEKKEEKTEEETKKEEGNKEENNNTEDNTEKAEKEKS